MIKKTFLLLFCSNIALAQNDTTRLAHVGFVYPLSTNGKEARQFTNGGSFHVVAGVSSGEKAFCLSGISNVIVHNADGFIMAGVVNYIGHHARGVQVAGISNVVRGNSEGVQLAGFSNSTKNSSGVQLAGFSNIVRDSSKGTQFAGFSNIARFSGSQFSGFSNIAREADGAQVSGFSNISRKISGIQITGFANIAKDIEGVQLAGFINIAQRVKGVQVAGFINIADSCEYPVGLINIIRNGEQYIGVSADEAGTTMLSLRSGSKKLYGILGTGFNFAKDELRYGLEGGMGMNITLSPWFRIKAELTVLSLTDFQNGVYMKSSVRILPAIKLAQRLEAYGGPTFGFSNYPGSLGDDLNMQYLWNRRSNGTFYGMNIGVIGGIQFRL